MANLHDVAAKSKVSVSTVSRIISEDPSFNVTEETREKVLRVAKDLGYKKKEVKEKKVISSTINIGVVQMYSREQLMDDPYYLKIENNLELHCGKYQINIVRLQRNEDGEVLIDENTSIMGLFAIGIFAGKEIDELKKVTNNIVFIDSSPNDLEYYGVVPNYRTGIETSVRYLIECGHTNIGFIGEEFALGDKKNRVIEPRKMYFEAVMKSIKLFNESNMVAIKNNVQSGYETMKKYLEENDHYPSAFFVSSDSCANGVIRGILEAGLRIPEDISLVAYNNTILSQFAMVPLTSVSVSVEKMALIALRNMEDLLEGSSFPVRTAISGELVIRESVRGV